MTNTKGNIISSWNFYLKVYFSSHLLKSQLEKVIFEERTKRNEEINIQVSKSWNPRRRKTRSFSQESPWNVKLKQSKYWYTLNRYLLIFYLYYFHINIILYKYHLHIIYNIYYSMLYINIILYYFYIIFVHIVI